MDALTAAWVLLGSFLAQTQGEELGSSVAADWTVTNTSDIKSTAPNPPWDKYSNHFATGFFPGRGEITLYSSIQMSNRLSSRFVLERLNFLYIFLFIAARTGV
jgi:hypothetical protein